MSLMADHHCTHKKQWYLDHFGGYAPCSDTSKCRSLGARIYLYVCELHIWLFICTDLISCVYIYTNILMDRYDILFNVNVCTCAYALDGLSPRASVCINEPPWLCHPCINCHALGTVVFGLLLRAVSSRKTPIIVLLTNFPQTKSAWVCIICCCSWFSFGDHWHHLSLDTHPKVGGASQTPPMWWWSGIEWQWDIPYEWAFEWEHHQNPMVHDFPIFSWWKSHEIAINKWDMLK